MTDTMSAENASQPKIVTAIPKKKFKEKLKTDMRKNWVVYCLFIPVAIYFLIFNYAPMVGIVMAFQDYSIFKGISGSEFIGFKNFSDLFLLDNFGNVLRNTSMMAILNLTIGFIATVCFAILLSMVKPKFFKRTVQISSYMPFFISSVVVVQIFKEFLNADGAITMVLTFFKAENQNWLANEEIPVFWIINCLIEIWQGCGYGAIVYCAAIANVNPNLHEAAAIDGAGRWKRLWNVTLPSILPLIITMFVLRVGLVFTQGFDKVILLQISSKRATSDCLATYINRVAFQGTANYGLAAAAGLFQSVIATFLLVFSNTLSRKLAKTSLF